MRFSILLFCAIALWQPQLSADQGLDACRPGCGANQEATGAGSHARILGASYSGANPAQAEKLRKGDLLGSLKMSGTWVSKLSFDRYVGAARRFCQYAGSRGQEVLLQIPLTFSSHEVSAALQALAAQRCKLRGIAIGNEVDRLVVERIVSRYAVADYIADYNRIVPLALKVFPEAKIIALELSSFAAREYKATDPATVKYKPVFDWLIPFSKARLVRRPDYLSVHYYPFTGAQKEWESLEAGRMFRAIMADLEPYLASAATPPLLIGEFNTTYQYDDNTAYPASGGDSFMIALTVFDLFGPKRVAGVFHWSLTEPETSTLGLYQGRNFTAVPLFYAYRMMADAIDHQPLPAHSGKARLDVHAFQRGSQYRLFLVNASPFFRRNISIAGNTKADINIEACSCEALNESATLPPLSITELAGDLANRASHASSRRFSYADRAIRSGEFSPTEKLRRYCSPLADFSIESNPAAHFENPKYNQNSKIGTGGTYIALSSPGTQIALHRTPGFLGVDCKLPAAGYSYFQCGVKFPVVADAIADRQAGMDWTEGYDKGSLRLTVGADAPMGLELHLEDYRPEALGQNTHQAKLEVAGLKTIDVPIREFAQLPGKGVSSPLRNILKNLSDMRIEVRQPGFGGQFRIYKLEVCDAL